MRAGVFVEPGNVTVTTVDDPIIEHATDAVVRIVASSVCGSDLWFYRGIEELEDGSRIGHEWMGVVEAVGAEVARVRKGDVVIAPFAYSDGSCPACRHGLPTSCANVGVWGGASSPGGGQAEAVRVPYADTNLFKLPAESEKDPELQLRLLPLADVLSTGHHAAVSGGVSAGSEVLIIGDGAVGQCAVIASRRLGAQRIVIAGHHDGRLDICTRFGATDAVETASTELSAFLAEHFPNGLPIVLECVGTQESVDSAIACVQDGGTVAYVGVPATGATISLLSTFDRNITIRGGMAPAARWIPQLVGEAIDGSLDASPIFDFQDELMKLPAAYEGMHKRRLNKAVVRP